MALTSGRRFAWDTNTAVLVIVLGALATLVVLGRVFAEFRVSATTA